MAVLAKCRFQKYPCTFEIPDFHILHDNLKTWMKVDPVLYSLPLARSKYLRQDWMEERKTIHPQSWYKSQIHTQQSTHGGEKGWSFEVCPFDLDDIVALGILES